MFKRLKKILTTNSSRKYLAIFAQRAASAIPKGAWVLDAGAGDCPYRSYFTHARYDSTDLCQVDKIYGQISYICDLSNVPIQCDCYDLVFCSQTLEHVPNPKKVLAEFSRVLKPGGQLWLTAPFFFEEHEVPYDYYRYTQFGLTHLVQAAGFTIQSLEWLEGYFGTLAYQLKQAAKALPLRSRDYGAGFIGWLIVGPAGLLKVLFAGLSLVFTWLDTRTKYVSSGQCKNYAVIAVKAGSKEMVT